MCDNCCMWWKRIKLVWGTYQHLDAVQRLLQTLGIWHWLILAGAMAMGALAQFWRFLPLGLRILMAVAISGLFTFLSGFVMCLVKIVRSESSQNKQITLPPPTDFLAPIFPLSPRITGTHAPGPALAPPLSEDECYACWSDTMSSTKELWLTVCNNSPNSSYSTITVISVHRWSDKQQQFIDTRTHYLGFAFEVYKGMAVPERRNRAEKVVICTRKGFEILGLERHRGFRGSDRGRWKIGLLIKLGTRERRQELCFKWNTSGLSQCLCSNDPLWDWTMLPNDSLTPQPCALGHKQPR
jgi:hypothetical protein